MQLVIPIKIFHICYYYNTLKRHSPKNSTYQTRITSTRDKLKDMDSSKTN